MIEAVHKRHLAAQVADSLRHYIRQRDLALGDRLPPERELAAAFAVSRNVVRQGLRILEKEGLIAVSHGQGNFVRTDLAGLETNGVAEESISRLEALEARGVFEAGLADLIVERMTDAEVDELDSIVATMRRQIADDRPTGDEEIAFHSLLLRSTRNPGLIGAGRTLILGYLRDYIFHTSLHSMLSSPEVVDVDEHAHIAAIVRHRDVASLRVVLRYHSYPMDSPERKCAGLLPYWLRGSEAHTSPT